MKYIKQGFLCVAKSLQPRSYPKERHPMRWSGNYEGGGIIVLGSATDWLMGTLWSPCIYKKIMGIENLFKIFAITKNRWFLAFRGEPWLTFQWQCSQSGNFNVLVISLFFLIANILDKFTMKSANAGNHRISHWLTDGQTMTPPPS